MAGEDALLQSQKTMGIHADAEKEFKPVDYENCSPSLPKGIKINPEQKLANQTLVVDTGANADFLQSFQHMETFSPSEVDHIVRKSIQAGLVDHHSLDSFFSAKGVDFKKCSTQMVNDYPEDVLQLIETHNISKVETHFDSDVDAIGSSYLIKSLIETKQLPVIAKDLAEVINLGDYGEDRQEPEAYVKSLAGTVSSVKGVMANRLKNALGKEVFGNPDMKDPATGRLKPEGVAKMNQLKADYENQGNKIAFELFNALNQLKIQDSSFDVKGDISQVQLSPESMEVIKAGREVFQKAVEDFLKDFEKAEKYTAVIKDRAGKDREVQFIVAESKNPLSFTNMSYMRTSPDTVTAVFGGRDKASGDHYDIGITMDAANTLDLSELCLAINQAERARRDMIYAKPEESRSDAEKTLITNWEGQNDREAFSGLNDKIAKGEIQSSQVVTKDPTVLVAGGSLIAASRTSLLSQEDFKTILNRFKKVE